MAEREDNASAWLSAARAGSPDALGQVLEGFRGYLLLIAQREMDPQLQAKGGASDLVQETLVDAVGHFDRFNGTSEGALRAWLRQLLLHNVADFGRHYRDTDKRQIDREVRLEVGDSSLPLGDQLAADTLSPSHHAMEDEQAQAIQRALEQLPEDYRKVIRLRYQEDKSFEEIGCEMQLTPNAARKLWARAVKRLQQESEGFHDAP
jgi:RNA polymerase sigma-70 factor, ECF subfamily